MERALYVLVPRYLAAAVELNSFGQISHIVLREIQHLLVCSPTPKDKTTKENELKRRQ